MEKEIAIKLIINEIKWCVENKKSGSETKEFKRGFIRGLEQALFLLEELTNN